MDELRQEYRAILEGLLDGAGEVAFLQAYDFARRCMREGLAPDDVMALHVQLVEGELAHHPDAAARTQGLLLEIIVAFSLNYRQALEDLERTNRELASTSRFKSRMLSMVAHDLTNHVTAIKLLARASQRGAAPELQDRLQHMLDVVDDEEHLIANLLDISRIDTGRLQLNVQPFCLMEILQRSVTRARKTTTSHVFSLQGPDPPVLADRVRIQQVVDNIIANAVKYSPDGGPIDVTTAVDGARLAVEVRDRGLGIAPEDQEHLFEPFFRSNRVQAGGIPGSGLGLAIVKSLMTMLDGTVAVESTPGEGTTVRITLPLAP